MIRAQQDLFPALVQIATALTEEPASELTVSGHAGEDQYRQVNSARVVIANGRIIIATDGVMGPVVVYNEAIDNESHFKSTEPQGVSYVTTLNGMKVAFKKDSSCGCGSRLKSWQPFRYVTSVQDPG